MYLSIYFNLTIILIVLKLLGVVSISWIWILLIPIGTITIIIGLMVAAFFALRALLEYL